MAPLPSREVLKSMKRVDLQNLCKTYGVKANLKTEELIEMLLQTQSAPDPPPARRSVPTTTTKRQSSRAGPSRTTSLIIHDIVDEDQDTDLEPEPELQDQTHYESQYRMSIESSEQALPTAVRTRRAKDQQLRLGVGRPTAAGGSGARAVTKSTSVPRSKRGRSSRTMSKVDAPIAEEVEPTSTVPTPKEQSGIAPSAPSPMAVDDVQSRIALALQPLQIKVETLEEELQRKAQQHDVEMQEIQRQLENVATLRKRYDALEAEVKVLRSESTTVQSLVEEFKLLKASLSSAAFTPPALPSTPKPRSPRLPSSGLGLGYPSAFKMGYPPMMETTPIEMPKGDAPPIPFPTAKMLGKRPRSASPVNGSTIMEAAAAEALSEEERARAVIRPTHKRAKMDETEPQPSVPGSSRQPGSREGSAQLHAPRIPGFTIFQGPETGFSTPSTSNATDRPPTPPGAPLLPPARTGPSRATSSATNEENQRRAFDFSMFPVGAEQDTYMQPIPFPGALQSPSPAGTTIGYMHQLSEDRTDPYKEFGFPSPMRARIPGSASRSATPAKRREVTSSDIAAGLGLTMVRTGTPDFSDVPPGGKTMYGTELDGETRFGDFGVEGVASGFWSTR